MLMFKFRIINTPDGNQIIDRTQGTSCDSMSPVEMLDYLQVEESLYFAERKQRKVKIQNKSVLNRLKNIFRKKVFA